jgi:hypothetical protein
MISRGREGRCDPQRRLPGTGALRTTPGVGTEVTNSWQGIGEHPDDPAATRQVVP